MTPHALRHTHTVHAAENGVPDSHLKKTLRHIKMNVTQIYLEIAQDDAVEMLKDRNQTSNLNYPQAFGSAGPLLNVL